MVETKGQDTDGLAGAALGTVRIIVQLDEDAVAECGETDCAFTVSLTIRIPIHSGTNKQRLVFKYSGDHADLRDLLSVLKKEKSIEIVAQLDGSGLAATCLRIERIEYRVVGQRVLKIGPSEA